MTREALWLVVVALIISAALAFVLVPLCEGRPLGTLPPCVCDGVADGMCCRWGTPITFVDVLKAVGFMLAMALTCLVAVVRAKQKLRGR